MGLTNRSTGRNAAEEAPVIQKRAPTDRVIALAGNPNVGKSSLFNALTGLNQHTGNWPGKTVSSAQGYCASEAHGYVLVDLPGTYSLLSHSPEEEVARDFLCFDAPDAAMVVCDATCLERGLNLVLQTLELCQRVLVCVNLMDEARRKHISLDLPLLSQQLGVPVIGVSAREKQAPEAILTALDRLIDGESRCAPEPVRYPASVESALARVAPVLEERWDGSLPARWLALRLLEGDETLTRSLSRQPGGAVLEEAALSDALERARELLAQQGIGTDRLKDLVVSTLVRRGEALGRMTVVRPETDSQALDRKLDRLLTSKRTGYPVMLALLAVIFWLTITWANYPSQLLAQGLFWVQDRLTELFAVLKAPEWLHGMLVLGVYRTLAWVVSVMLPPMAIFFPLFTLLEDVGYLPRVAYNLDRPFQRCRACGKQALTMCIVNTNM